MTSFIAAGSAYAAHGINTIPFLIYYSMFGLQRISRFYLGRGGYALAADSFWAGRRDGRLLRAKDCNTRTGTATFSRCRFQDPRVRSGVRVRNCRDHPGRHPPMYQGRRERFLLHHRNERTVRDACDARGRRKRDPQGHVQSPRSENKKSKIRAQLFGSGAILNEALKPQKSSRKNTA